MLHKFFVAISIVSVAADRPAVVVVVEFVDVNSSIQETFWQHSFPAMAPSEPWTPSSCDCEWEPFVAVNNQGAYCYWCAKR